MVLQAQASANRHAEISRSKNKRRLLNSRNSTLWKSLEFQNYLRERRTRDETNDHSVAQTAERNMDKILTSILQKLPPKRKNVLNKILSYQYHPAQDDNSESDDDTMVLEHKHIPEFESWFNTLSEKNRNKLLIKSNIEPQVKRENKVCNSVFPSGAKECNGKKDAISYDDIESGRGCCMNGNCYNPKTIHDMFDKIGNVDPFTREIIPRYTKDRLKRYCPLEGNHIIRSPKPIPTHTIKLSN
jgi:hypothetical protein